MVSQSVGKEYGDREINHFVHIGLAPDMLSPCLAQGRLLMIRRSTTAFLLHYFLILLAVMLGGCTANSESIDLLTHWIDGIPCEPPCWQGITPGQTTAFQAVEILRSNAIVT